MRRYRYRVFVCAVLALLVEAGAARAEPGAWIRANLDGIVDLYRHFHRNPELSFEEKGTAARLAAELEAAGAEVTTSVGGHGVVAILRNGRGPAVMLRTDLDALPVVEETGLAYASRVKVKTENGGEVGVMHACGHDVHITNLVGVARYLAAHRDLWRGTVVLIGQPAEERGAGARAMLEAGLFERFPRPDFALALHVASDLPAGRIGYRAGYALANTNSVDITVRGRGGHGSAPHTTIDPIVQAAYLIVDLQTIVSREVDPIRSAVVTVGSIHGGTKHNIIGSDCHLQLTVRSYDAGVRAHVLEAIQRKALAAAKSAGAPDPIVKVDAGTPALFNDPALVERIVPVFERVLGKENVVEVEPVMGGEDFSRYGLAGVPIFLFRLGSVELARLEKYTGDGNSPPSLHSALYYPDPEQTLSTGVVAMASAALELLR
jgi:hippurate hydrolase